MENEDIGQVSGEEMGVGRIGIQAYIRLLRAGASVLFLVGFFMLNIIVQVRVQNETTSIKLLFSHALWLTQRKRGNSSTRGHNAFDC